MHFPPAINRTLVFTIISLGILVNLIQFGQSQLVETTDIPYKMKTSTKFPKMRWTYSIHALQYLVEKEFQLYQLMKNFEIDVQTKLNKVTSWLDDFKESSLKGTEHLTNQAKIVEEVSSHPLMIFRMVRRFVNLKHHLLLQFQPDQRKLDKWKNFYCTNKCWSYESQVYEIAIHAEKINAFTQAIFWFQTLAERNLTTIITYHGHLYDDNFEINSAILIDHIYQVSKKHDELIDKINDHNFWEFEHRFTRKIHSDLGGQAELFTLKEDLVTNYPGLSSPYTGFTFQSVCAGKLSMSEEQKSKLYCFYETKLHSNWYINPLKVEVYSWDPYVARIYDAVNETVTKYLQSMSKQELIPAEVINESFNKSDPNSQGTKMDKSRTAMFAFLMKKTKMLDYLALKIGYMTGLEVYNKNGIPVSSENVQVASYSIGGWYDYHLDALKNAGFFDPLEGDRIATFMIYLNDVTLGGNTVFPQLGVSVQPIKNSAVFWYNLHKNGEIYYETFHGGCPVLIGQKSIANIWIRTVANFQRRKCSLNPNE